MYTFVYIYIHIHVNRDTHFDRLIEVAPRYLPASCLTIPSPTGSGHILGAHPPWLEISTNQLIS